MAREKALQEEKQRAIDLELSRAQLVAQTIRERQEQQEQQEQQPPETQFQRFRREARERLARESGQVIDPFFFQ